MKNSVVLLGSADVDPAATVRIRTGGTLPTRSDCSVGGVCDSLGKKASQCDLNGFRITGGLPLPLATQRTSFTTPADPTAPESLVSQETRGHPPASLRL